MQHLMISTQNKDAAHDDCLQVIKLKRERPGQGEAE
jgi:hypothetical protein